MVKKKLFNKDLLFYVLMLAFPILQFCVFYIGVNGRSFLYSFQIIDGSDYSKFTWDIKPLVSAFKELTSKTVGAYILHSLVGFVLVYSISTVLALLFSYFIFKKLPFGNFFRVVLFLPSILSAIVMAVIFLQFADGAIPEIFNFKISGLFATDSTRFATVIFYNIFISFGTTVLMYSNAMSGISTDIIEAAKLDGCNSGREFVSVVLPNVFPTISTFAITSTAGIFVNQLSLYSLFGNQAKDEVATIGYFLYRATLDVGRDETAYPKLCAEGLLITLVAVPLTLLVKYLLDRFGPSDK